VKAFTYVEPSDAAGVVSALRSGDSRVIAGGSDLLGELKEGIKGYATLVSLNGLGDGLRRIVRRPDGGFEIGALVTISELEYATELTGPYRLFAEAARSVATPEIRNQGTLGGNLCQRPRCLYYRNLLTPCLRKGGDACPAKDSPYQDYLSVFGDADGCCAVNASDLGPPLVAMSARIVVQGASGTREIDAEAFFIADATSETALGAGEVVTSVILPPLAEAWHGHYIKGRERTAGDFPVVSVALGYELEAGVMHDVRVVLGAVALTPRRSREAEAMLEGQAPSEDVASRAVDAALADATPLEHNAFKLDLARALIGRAVMRLAAPS
jgi:xanthine dehydrogenase YagS FAD-binding subunit